MRIPLSVKRRYVEISEYLDDNLRRCGSITMTQEGFIVRICENMSLWYIHNYQRGPYESPQSYHRTLGEHTLIFKYMFRTKLREHYERDKGKPTYNHV